MPEDTTSRPPARAFWSGTIAFGLVTVPVDLLPAVRSRRVSLRMLAPDGTPLSRRYRCPREERLLDPAEIVRGYEIDEGEFVVVTDQELDALEPEKSREIDLRRFVPRESIDPVFFERPYFLAPSGESTKAYRLLARVMEESGKAGVGTFVMRGKEYLAAILAERGILRLETLRFAAELRSPEDVGLSDPSDAEPELADRMREGIETLSTDSLDPDELEDRYADRLESLVGKKLAEDEDVMKAPEKVREEIEETEVVDLMEVLKRRLQGEGATADRREPPLRSVRSTEDLEERTKKELYDLARDLEVPGRSSMTKDELIRAIRRSA